MGREYTYYGVEVEPFFDDKPYYYLADTDYDMNEYVIVPFGKKQLLGVISEIKHCSAQDAPYPPEKTKKISARLRMMKSVENQSQEKKLTIPMTAAGQGKHRHVLISMRSCRRSARWN